MNILFVHISKNWHGRVYPEYPMGIGIIATLANQAGYNVHIHDMAVDDTPLELVLNNFKPDITGISFLSTSATTASFVIKQLLDLDCGHLIAGGIHTSIFPENVVLQGVDIAVIGEGEISIISLLKKLENLKTKKYSLEYFCDIPNLVFNGIEGEIVHTKKSNESVQLDNVPPVNRSLFNLSLYPHHSIITSRGCPYRCKFCCAWGPGGKKGRMASPERILSELEQLVELYGNITVYWADDMFFFNRVVAR